MPFIVQPPETDPHSDLDMASEDALLALWGEPDEGDLIQLDEAPGFLGDLDS